MGTHMAKANDFIDPRIRAQRDGLYDPFFEHSSCGVGFVVNVDGRKTHQIVINGITILKNLVHRGAVGGYSRTGDGAGMLVQVPHRFFEREADRLGFSLPAEGLYGVAMLFLPVDQEKRTRARELVEDAVTAGEGTLLGWREVPANPELLGELALASMPHISQAFASFGTNATEDPNATEYRGPRGRELSGEALERKLYVTRKVIESMAAAEGFSM